LLYVANSDPQVLKCFSCMSVWQEWPWLCLGGRRRRRRMEAPSSNRRALDVSVVLIPKTRHLTTDVVFGY
jgi:hypothetical protein